MRLASFVVIALITSLAYGKKEVVNCYGKDDSIEVSVEGLGSVDCSDLAEKGQYSDCQHNSDIEDACECTCDALKENKKPVHDRDGGNSGGNSGGDDGDDGDGDGGGTSDGGDCFHGDDILTTEMGPRRIGDMAGVTGVRVLAADREGRLRFTQLKFWAHVDPSKEAEFLEIRANGNAALSLTPKHLVFVAEGSTNPRVKTAQRVKLGDHILVANEQGTFSKSKILSITSVNKTGIYLPITEEGTIIVNGVSASCYSNFEDQTAVHFFFRYVDKLRSILPASISGILWGEPGQNVPLSRIFTALDAASKEILM